MGNSSTLAVRRMVFTALCAAVCYVATVAFRIPTPTGGYVNLGDGFVLLSGFLLGPWLGALAGGIGSALADLLAGCGAYVPGTFLVKALTALVGAALFRALSARRNGTLSAMLAGTVGECCMVLGYFGYEAAALGYGAAAVAELPANGMQALAGVAVGTLLSAALLRIPFIQKTMRGLKHAN